MVSVEIHESLQDGPTFVVVGPKFEKRVNEMKQNGTLKAAMDDLREKRAFHQTKIAEIDKALDALKSVASDDTAEYQTTVMHPTEFAKAGIAEAAVMLIKRANRPLHVKDIAGALKAGGYTFKTDNPMGSIAPVLYMAAKNSKHGLVNKGKNTYSIIQIEANE
jgi:hypothetical protein